MFKWTRFATTTCAIVFWCNVSRAEQTAKPFDCVTNDCGIAINGTYPNLIVGTVDGIASPAASVQLFIEARKKGLWTFLPPDPYAFSRNIQPISMRVSGQDITVVESTAEMKSDPAYVGELVRFAPHRGIHMAPDLKDPYWFSFGCLEILCAQNDTKCQKDYRVGLYQTSSGAQLDSSGRHLVAGGIIIDTMTMYPKRGR